MWGYMDKRLVYLCGGINGLSDKECYSWRYYATSYLHADTLDPMRRDYRGIEMNHGVAEKIVKGDLEDIERSWLILANHPAPSVGTDMEIFAAKHVFGKPVITVVPDLKYVSPWLAFHSDKMFTSLHEAVSYINSL